MNRYKAFLFYRNKYEVRDKKGICIIIFCMMVMAFFSFRFWQSRNEIGLELASAIGRTSNDLFSTKVIYEKTEETDFVTSVFLCIKDSLYASATCYEEEIGTDMKEDRNQLLASAMVENENYALNQENENKDAKNTDGKDSESVKGKEDEKDNKKEDKKEDKKPSSGVTYTKDQLSDYDYVTSHFYVIDGKTELRKSVFDPEKLMKMDLSLNYDMGDNDDSDDSDDSDMEDFNDNETRESKDNEPKILIYHTHASESFKDSKPGEISDTIVGVGSVLSDILEDQYGIPVYHDVTIYDMVDGKLDRSYAYHQSSEGVDEILKKYPSIEVVIDLHRDGVNDKTHLVTEIDGKKTAKIMLFNGVSYSKKRGDIEYLNNPNLEGNLAFSLQLYVAGSQMYKDYMRRNYICSYRYNLDKKKRALLIEAGAQTNTVEEEKNAMEPLARILYEVLSEKKE